MLKMKLISLLKNTKVRVSLSILLVIVTIVAIIAWPVSKAETPIYTCFGANSIGVSVGGAPVYVQFGDVDRPEKRQQYGKMFCIDEGTMLSYQVYTRQMDLYNKEESSRYFRNYNSALWVVDNMYLSDSSNSKESLDYLAALVTSPEVKSHVTAYGDVTVDQIKSLDKTIGGQNNLYQNLIELTEQYVLWNYTDNANNRKSFDNLVDGGIYGRGITNEDQIPFKYLYHALRYLADKNSSYTSTGTISNGITLDSSSAKIDIENNKVGPYYVKANGSNITVTKDIVSKISGTLTDASGNTKSIDASNIIVENEALYISAADAQNLTKSTLEFNNIYSGTKVTGLIVSNGRTQNLLSIKKTNFVNNYNDSKEVVYSGKYTVKLIKTNSDGATPITNNHAKFTITGATTMNGVYTNNDGILGIVEDKTIGSVEDNDIYSIVEDEAPKGFDKYNGTISLDVKFKRNGTKYVIDTEKTTFTATGTNGTAKMNFDDENTISIYVPNQPENKIHKGVKEVYNQDSGYDKDEIQDWVIQTQLPETIGNYKKFIITDKIDSRLVFQGTDSVRVSVVNGEKLTANVDYKAEYDENTKTLKVSFVEGDFKGQNLTAKSIVEIRFNTKFATDENGTVIALNQSVPNQATLVYDNGNGQEKEIKSETPEVHTGSVGLFKFDDRNKNGVHDKNEPALVGAHFKIARSKEDAENKVFVKDANGKELEVITNEHGVAVFEGLEFGEDAMNKEKYKTGADIFGNPVYAYNWEDEDVKTTYYIVETESPEGYSLIKNPIPAVIKKDNYNIDDISSLIQVGNRSNIHDLSLRKFITAVDDKEIKDRIPEDDPSNIDKVVDGKVVTTANYTKAEEPVLVAQNQIVTYTIRIYNEGPQDTYATLVKDNLPEGLEFVTYTEGDGSINDEYKWKLYDENGNEVKDPSKASYAESTYLGMNNKKNLIKAFHSDTDKKLDYRDLKIQFKVVEPNTSDRILINKAQIAEERNDEGEVVKDRDSVANVWNEGEDDQDIEKVRVLYFDLALRKWVTQAIIIENGETRVVETGHKAEDDPESIVKVDLKKSKIKDVTVKFRYSIRVTNQGEIAGEAQEIEDIIPEGLRFDPTDNPDWKIVDGKYITEKLKNTTLQPGESAEVEILLTWINSEDNLGLKVNTAEIHKDHNKYGVKDIDSTPGNHKTGEDDIDDAPVMLSVKTGGTDVVGYIAVALAVISIIGAGVLGIKKFVA